MRFWILIALLSLAVLGLIFRMVHLSVTHRAFLLGQGDARASRVIDIPAYRGMILDRNHQPLAISTPVDAVWVNPRELNLNSQVIPTLSTVLQIPLIEVSKKLRKHANRSFLYLKHGVDPQVGNQLRTLNLAGVYFQREYRRYYPEAEVTAHVLGFTNLNDQGQEGVELAYNQWLAGIVGKRQVIKNRLGDIISSVTVLRQPRPGHDLVLSIDRRIQYLAYAALKAGVEKFQAASGTAVVLDCKTGEILAMVNQPSYNPNNHAKFDESRYRNRAVTDIFEPGSTVKSFSVLSALTSGSYTPTSLINTVPGWFMVQGHRVEDEHTSGLMTLTTVLQKSSNVGIAKITLSLPAHRLWRTLNAVGFGEITEVHFPGERSGLLVNRTVWSPFALATLSFGYGLSTTVLQLAKAYAILANGGMSYPVSLLKTTDAPRGTRVFPAKPTQQLMAMLETVLQAGGTASHVNVPGYRVAGKTGTARLIGKYGYEKHRHNSMFVGIAPVTRPRLVVAVVLSDPKGKHYYGGEVAAPVFSTIMGGALRLLNVPPDREGYIGSKQIHFTQQDGG